MSRLGIVRRKLTLVALLLASTLVFFLLAEFAVRLFLVNAEQRKTGAAALFSRYQNHYVTALREGAAGSGCHFTDLLIPHPNLAVIFKLHPYGIKGCKLFSNNQGFASRVDYPVERDERFFNIMVTGGSVADLFARGDWEGEIWLEKNLNRDFISPNGKPFRILNFAIGGGKQPFQSNVIAFYGQIVHGVVVIDGYNDIASAHLASLDSTNLLFSSLMKRGTLLNLFANGLKRMREICFAYPFLKNSFFLYRIFIGGMQFYVDVLDQFNRLYGRGFQPSEKNGQSIGKSDLGRFEYYMNLMQGQAAGQGLKFAHFLQPVPLLEKTLTAKEASMPHFISKESYVAMDELFQKKKKAGFPAYSLVRLFSGNAEEVYRDDIHFYQPTPTKDSYGNVRMAGAISRELGGLWGLKKKTPQPGGKGRRTGP